MFADAGLMIIASSLAGFSVAAASGRILPVWDALANQRIGSLGEMLEPLSISEARVAMAMRAWGAAMIATPLVFGLMLGLYIVVGPLMILVFQSPRWILAWIVARRKREIRDQMVPVCFALANTARSGLSLPRGLEEVMRDSPWPIQDELRRIVMDFHRGRTIIDAIRDAQLRLKLDSFNIFANVIRTCFESGAKYTEALDTLSLSLQENQRLERKLSAETAAGQTVILVLGGFPFMFLGMFYLLEPSGTAQVFSTVVGQCVLVVVGFLTYLSVKLASKILAIEI